MKKTSFISVILVSFVAVSMLFTSAKAPVPNSAYSPKDIFRDASPEDMQKVEESISQIFQNHLKASLDALYPMDSPATIYQYVLTATGFFQDIDENGLFILIDDSASSVSNAASEPAEFRVDLKKLMDDYIAKNGTHPLIELAYAKYWTTLTVETALYYGMVSSDEQDFQEKIQSLVQNADKHYIAAMLREYYTEDTFLDWAYILASDHLGTSEYEKAIQILKWGVMIYPNATFNYHLANKLYYCENWEETVGVAQTALNLDKTEKVLDADTRLDLYYFICYSHLNLDKLDDARKNWAKAAKEFKNDSIIVYNQGIVELKAGKFSQARKFFVKAFNMDQSDLESAMQALTLYFAGSSLFPEDESHLDEAVLLTDQLAKAAKDSYTKTVIKYYKAQILVMDGQFEKALPLLDQVEEEFISAGDDPAVTHEYIQQIRDFCSQGY